MRIFFIANSKAVLEERFVFEGLKSLGHEIVMMDENRFKIDDYIYRITNFKPDFVLFFKLRTAIPGIYLIKKLRELGIPTVSWIFDLILGHPIRHGTANSYHFLKADYVFMTDGGHDLEYKNLGINKYTLRQGIYEDFCYAAKPDGPIKDIVFVGTENPSFPYRQKLMRFLLDTYGFRFHWVGKDNPMECREHKLNQLIANSKIIIGDCMYSPNYWSNRIYEMLGRGAFLIHPRVVGIEDEFTWYKHLIPYDWSNFQTLKEKIDFFLIHDKERDLVRKAAMRHVKKNYLYKHRCAQLIENFKYVHRN